MSAQQLLQCYQSALARQDWAAVEPLIHPQACFVFSDGSFIGKAEIEGAFRRTFALIQNEEYQISQLQWTYEDAAMACCHYHFTWRGLIDGKECGGGGRGSSVLRCDEAGWRIVLEHLGPLAE